MDTTNVRSFAFIGDDYLEGSAKAIAVTFPGLGGMDMRSSLDGQEIYLAAKGMLFVYPFVTPWNWMNAGTVSFTDTILDIVKGSFASPDCPILVKGGSMGGFSALAYSMFTKHRLSAILAICPVCDLVFHYSERPDLPRTMHGAYENYGDISEVLQSRSPVHNVDRMQDCTYLIVHGIKDKAVGKASHSDKLVPLMKSRGMDVAYVEDQRMEHCGPWSLPSLKRVDTFLSAMVG